MENKADPAALLEQLVCEEFGLSVPAVSHHPGGMEAFPEARWAEKPLRESVGLPTSGEQPKMATSPGVGAKAATKP